jgi:hypothetical protein
VRLLLLPAPLLLLSTGCSTLHTRDVAAAFAADAPALVNRNPTKTDMDPARAANAPGVMLETERVAREYLARKGDGSAPAAYVRALLACSLLAQGRPLDARDTLRGTKPRREAELTRENAVVWCAIHATSACRSVEARAAAEAFLAGKLPALQFARDYGSFAGLAVAEPDAPEHGNMLKLAAANLEASCAPGVAQPTAAAAKARAEFRRTLSEQVYNDAAALLARLGEPPPMGPRDADDVWLARVAVKAVSSYRYLILDMLPVDLTPDQKAWQREQAISLFKNARGRTAWFLPKEARERVESSRAPKTPDETLYDRLLSAQLEVVAWIDSR